MIFTVLRSALAYIVPRTYEIIKDYGTTIIIKVLSALSVRLLQALTEANKTLLAYEQSRNHSY